MSVRERLAELISDTGITQSEVARRVGETPQWVNNRLLGVVAIQADDLPRLAAALRRSPCDFFPPDTREGAPPSYTDTFTRAMAAAWQREMTEADRELMETMAAALARYRERLTAAEGRE